MSDNVRYAVCCKACGHIEDKAWEAPTETTHSKRTEKALTPSGQVPMYCVKCGQRQWEKPATKEQLEKHDNRLRQEARAIELTRSGHFEGVFNVPDELSKVAPEIKRALSNLLGPLEGETLKQAQQNIIKVAKSGIQETDALAWIELYDRAVQKAIANTSRKVA